MTKTVTITIDANKLQSYIDSIDDAVNTIYDTVYKFGMHNITTRLLQELQELLTEAGDEQ